MHNMEVAENQTLSISLVVKIEDILNFLKLNVSWIYPNKFIFGNCTDTSFNEHEFLTHFDFNNIANEIVHECIVKSNKYLLNIFRMCSNVEYYGFLQNVIPDYNYNLKVFLGYISDYIAKSYYDYKHITSGNIEDENILETIEIN